MNKPHGLYKHFDFFICDIVCLVVAYWLAIAIRLGPSVLFVQSVYQEMLAVILIADLMVVMLLEPYKNILKRGKMVEFKMVIEYSGAIFIGIVLYMFSTKKSEDYSRIVIYTFLILELIFVYTERIAKKLHIKSKAEDVKKRRNLLLVTNSDDVYDIIPMIKEDNYNILTLSGVVITDTDRHVGNDILGIPVVSTKDGIYDYLKNHVVDEVYIGSGEPDKNEIAEHLVEMGTIVNIGIEDMLVLPNAYVTNLFGLTAVNTSISDISFKQATIKRIFDVFVGLVGSAITIVMTIFIGPIIFIADPGPIFFRQERVGRNGRHFKIWKYRSMYKDAEARKAQLMDQNEMNGLMFKMENDPRIIGSGKDGSRHGIGWFIRKFSIDEFPQFFNILVGDMSLVGTRPPTAAEVEQYESYHMSRLALRPGLTGLWQVSGRSDIVDFEEVVRLDNEYIRNFSIRNDIKIILKTFKVVLGGEGSK